MKEEDRDKLPDCATRATWIIKTTHCNYNVQQSNGASGRVYNFSLFTSCWLMAELTFSDAIWLL